MWLRKDKIEIQILKPIYTSLKLLVNQICDTW